MADTAGEQFNDVNSEQYLTFILAGEEYGVDILRVQEIKGWDSATEIPNTPDYIRGVINLRGTIVPVIDMRARFRMDTVEYGQTTVVIVLKVYGSDNSERTMGFVVDAVSDVYDVPTQELKPPPDFGSVVSTDFIRGMATIDDKMIILLEIDRLVDADAVTAQTEH
ncbi:MAG: chemotaxis protein CheW [Gammaproteobacteria bacterium]